MVHGALAGVFFGIISEGVAAAIALMLFTPLLLVILLRRHLPIRQAVVGGLILAGTGIVFYLTRSSDSDEPLMQVTSGRALSIICWLLAWTVYGALLLVFGGATHLGLIIGYMKGGISRAAQWGRAGALAGLVLGGLLAGLYSMDLPGAYAGGALGAVAGLLLGAASGQTRWQAPLLLLGTGLGAATGMVDLESVYTVIGAGVSGGLYWAVAGALVGIFTGASVGSKLPDRVTDGPLYGSILPAIPLPKGQGLNLATGLLAAAGGTFLGGSIGLVAGSIFAGIAAATMVAGPEFLEDNLAVRLLGGTVLGALLTVLFSARRASTSRVIMSAGRVLRAVPLSGLPLLYAAVGGAALGGGITLLAWGLNVSPGEVLYWLFAGAAIGGIVGAKLWSVVER
jgi:hypothetical protein